MPDFFPSRFALIKCKIDGPSSIVKSNKKIVCPSLRFFLYLFVPFLFSIPRKRLATWNMFYLWLSTIPTLVPENNLIAVNILGMAPGVLQGNFEINWGSIYMGPGFREAQDNFVGDWSYWKIYQARAAQGDRWSQGCPEKQNCDKYLPHFLQSELCIVFCPKMGSEYKYSFHYSFWP